MPYPQIDASGFSGDILEFIRLLARHRVRYVIVGGEAVIFHGHPRLTGDVDFFYQNTASNVSKLHAALLEFWHDDIPGISDATELAEHGVIIQFGRPPNRIDLMNSIDGVSFANAWESRLRVSLKNAGSRLVANYIGLVPLLKNKLASGRPKDMDDYAFLKGKRAR